MTELILKRKLNWHGKKRKKSLLKSSWIMLLKMNSLNQLMVVKVMEVISQARLMKNQKKEEMQLLQLLLFSWYLALLVLSDT